MIMHLWEDSYDRENQRRMRLWRRALRNRSRSAIFRANANVVIASGRRERDMPTALGFRKMLSRWSAH